jgi:hypothetical protein
LAHGPVGTAGRLAAVRSVTGKADGAARLGHGLGDLLGTLRSDRLPANGLVLHLWAFVRSVDLPRELLVSPVLRTRATSQDSYLNNLSVGQVIASAELKARRECYFRRADGSLANLKLSASMVRDSHHRNIGTTEGS